MESVTGYTDRAGRHGEMHLSDSAQMESVVHGSRQQQQARRQQERRQQQQERRQQERAST